MLFHTPHTIPIVNLHACGEQASGCSRAYDGDDTTDWKTGSLADVNATLGNSGQNVCPTGKVRVTRSRCEAAANTVRAAEGGVASGGTPLLSQHVRILTRIHCLMR